MGNAISFRLNPKCESDRKILDWLEKKSSQPGYLNQTELIKQALLSTMESEQRGIREKKTTEWMDEAILRVTKEFTKVVQESSQNVANNMFAGVLGAMAQQMNMGVVPVTPMQTTGAVPNGMTVAVPNATQNAMPMAVTVNVPEPPIPDNELATDTYNVMDSATKDMLGSLFDMDDE